jgi:hypothetical protein
MLGTPCQRCGVDSPLPPGAQQPRCNKHSQTPNRGTFSQHAKKDFVAVALKNAREERKAKPDTQSENTQKDVGTSRLHQSSNVRNERTVQNHFDMKQ